MSSQDSPDSLASYHTARAETPFPDDGTGTGTGTDMNTSNSNDNIDEQHAPRPPKRHCSGKDRSMYGQLRLLEDEVMEGPSTGDSSTTDHSGPSPWKGSLREEPRRETRRCSRSPLFTEYSSETTPGREEEEEWMEKGGDERDEEEEEETIKETIEDTEEDTTEDEGEGNDVKVKMEEDDDEPHVRPGPDRPRCNFDCSPGPRRESSSFRSRDTSVLSETTSPGSSSTTREEKKVDDSLVEKMALLDMNTDRRDNVRVAVSTSQSGHLTTDKLGYSGGGNFYRDAPPASPCPDSVVSHLDPILGGGGGGGGSEGRPIVERSTEEVCNDVLRLREAGSAASDPAEQHEPVGDGTEACVLADQYQPLGQGTQVHIAQHQNCFFEQGQTVYLTVYLTPDQALSFRHDTQVSVYIYPSPDHAERLRRGTYIHLQLILPPGEVHLLGQGAGYFPGVFLQVLFPPDQDRILGQDTCNFIQAFLPPNQAELRWQGRILLPVFLPPEQAQLLGQDARVFFDVFFAHHDQAQLLGQGICDAAAPGQLLLSAHGTGGVVSAYQNQPCEEGTGGFITEDQGQSLGEGMQDNTESQFLEAVTAMGRTEEEEEWLKYVNWPHTGIEGPLPSTDPPIGQAMESLLPEQPPFVEDDTKGSPLTGQYHVSAAGSNNGNYKRRTAKMIEHGPLLTKFSVHMRPEPEDSTKGPTGARFDITFDPGSDHVLVCNKGSVEIQVYRLRIGISEKDVYSTWSRSLRPAGRIRLKPGYWLFKVDDHEDPDCWSEVRLLKRTFKCEYSRIVAPTLKRRWPDDVDEEKEGEGAQGMASVAKTGARARDNPLVVAAAERVRVQLPDEQDSYEIECDRYVAELSNQGSGAVFGGIHSKYGGDVAVKLKRVRDADHVVRLADRFTNEVFHHSQLDHPSIVKFVGCDSRFLATFTELLPYSDLSRRLGSFAVRPPDGGKQAEGIPFTGTTEDAECVLRDIASALAYLQTVPGGAISHNDIKPSNILYKPGHHAVLIDFSMATTSNDGRLSGGTAPYVAPEAEGLGPGEQRRGPEGDVYALGVTMLYLLRKTEMPETIPDNIKWPMFKGTSEYRSWMGQAAAMAGELEGGTGEIVRRMLVQDPARRISAQGILDALELLRRERMAPRAGLQSLGGTAEDGSEDAEGAMSATREGEGEGAENAVDAENTQDEDDAENVENVMDEYTEEMEEAENVMDAEHLAALY